MVYVVRKYKGRQEGICVQDLKIEGPKCISKNNEEVMVTKIRTGRVYQKRHSLLLKVLNMFESPNLSEKP